MSYPREVNTCPDCGVEPSKLHTVNCDVARCILCGWQDMSCDCEDNERPMTTWTGLWPGVVECQELDIWSYFGPPWTKCEKDHPEAGEDLNELSRMHARGELIWDSEKERLVRP